MYSIIDQIPLFLITSHLLNMVTQVPKSWEKIKKKKKKPPSRNLPDHKCTFDDLGQVKFLVTRSRSQCQKVTAFGVTKLEKNGSQIWGQSMNTPSYSSQTPPCESVRSDLITGLYIYRPYPY